LSYILQVRYEPHLCDKACSEAAGFQSRKMVCLSLSDWKMLMIFKDKWYRCILPQMSCFKQCGT